MHVPINFKGTLFIFNFPEIDLSFNIDTKNGSANIRNSKIFLAASSPFQDKALHEIFISIIKIDELIDTLNLEECRNKRLDKFLEKDLEQKINEANQEINKKQQQLDYVLTRKDHIGKAENDRKSRTERTLLIGAAGIILLFSGVFYFKTNPFFSILLLFFGALITVVTFAVTFFVANLSFSQPRSESENSDRLNNEERQIRSDISRLRSQIGRMAGDLNSKIPNKYHRPDRESEAIAARHADETQTIEEHSKINGNEKFYRAANAENEHTQPQNETLNNANDLGLKIDSDEIRIRKRKNYGTALLIGGIVLFVSAYIAHTRFLENSPDDKISQSPQPKPIIVDPWSSWQLQMEQEFQNIESSKQTESQRIELWKSFLSKWNENNPKTNLDDELRNQARVNLGRLWEVVEKNENSKQSSLDGVNGQSDSEKILTSKDSTTENYGSIIGRELRRHIVFTDSQIESISSEIEIFADDYGNITSRRLLQSSGRRDWDEACLRAIDRMRELPKDIDGKTPKQTIVVFRTR